MRTTGILTPLPSAVFKDGKSHALISERSVNKLDNLSCVFISEWEYIFWVTYVFRRQQRFSTLTDDDVNVVEQSFALKNKYASQHQDSSRYLSRDFNLEGHNITLSEVIGLIYNTSRFFKIIILLGGIKKQML